MGWDVTEYPHPRPCGQGTYTRQEWSEDWGRHRTEYRMDCPACREHYVLWVVPAPIERRHKDSDWATWLPRATEHERRSLEQQAREAREAVLELARQVFGPQLLAELSEVKFKTRMHRILVERMGQGAPGFSRFDRAVKAKGLKEAIQQLIDVQHLPALLSVLNDPGEHIERGLAEYAQALQTSTAFEQQLRKTAERLR